MIHLEGNTKAARDFLERLQREFTPEATDAVVEAVAWRTHAALVEATPTKYTGQTRASWLVKQNGRGFQVTNPSKIMLFLEEGTKAHGPVKARALYIPLNRTAALNGWNPGLVFGQDYVLAKRVAGIKARKIVEGQRPITKQWLHDDMTAFVQRIVRG